jgi:hypothetical protein
LFDASDLRPALDPDIGLVSIIYRLPPELRDLVWKFLLYDVLYTRTIEISYFLGVKQAAEIVQDRSGKKRRYPFRVRPAVAGFFRPVMWITGERPDEPGIRMNYMLQSLQLAAGGLEDEVTRSIIDRVVIETEVLGTSLGRALWNASSEHLVTAGISLTRLYICCKASVYTPHFVNCSGYPIFRAQLQDNDETLVLQSLCRLAEEMCAELRDRVGEWAVERGRMPFSARDLTLVATSIYDMQLRRGLIEAQQKLESELARQRQLQAQAQQQPSEDDDERLGSVPPQKWQRLWDLPEHMRTARVVMTAEEDADYELDREYNPIADELRDELRDEMLDVEGQDPRLRRHLRMRYKYMVLRLTSKGTRWPE